MEGYNHEVETRLLESIRWTENGYRLFENAVPAGSSRLGFFGHASESNCLFMSRSLFQQIGGFDERYSEPGGGLVNLDFFWRAATAARVVFTLLGEGHFHQVHGGAATGLPPGEQTKATRARWKAEYERLSRPWEKHPPYEPILSGHVPAECRRWVEWKAA